MSDACSHVVNWLRVVRLMGEKCLDNQRVRGNDNQPLGGRNEACGPDAETPSALHSTPGEAEPRPSGREPKLPRWVQSRYCLYAVGVDAASLLGVAAYAIDSD